MLLELKGAHSHIKEAARVLCLELGERRISPLFTLGEKKKF